MTRLLATDLDGTLLRSDLSVSDRTRRALADARSTGVRVVFMTGRPLRWLGLAIDETQHRSMLACANGAMIWDAVSEQTVTAHPLDAEVARAAAATLKQIVPGIGFAVERLPLSQKLWREGDETRTHPFAHDPAYVPKWPMPAGTPVGDIDELVATGDVVKLLGRAPIDVDHSADTLLKIAIAELEGIVEVTHSNAADLLLEVSAHGVSKASALAEIAQHFGIPQSDVVAVGDMPNDLSMLKWAGQAYAVENAHDDVRRVVDGFLPANDDDGVAMLIEQMLRGER